MRLLIKLRFGFSLLFIPRRYGQSNATSHLGLGIRTLLMEYYLDLKMSLKHISEIGAGTRLTFIFLNLDFRMNTYQLIIK